MTTYKATAERQGRFWVVTVNGLPEGEQNVTQGLTWDEAQLMARDLISLVLDIEDDPHTFTVELAPADPEMAAVLREAEDADQAAREADERRRAAVLRAARTLTDRGLTQADAGRMLGVTHQRIAQLAPKRTKKPTAA